MKNEQGKTKRKAIYPIVMKDKKGNLEIIYRNRVEFYKSVGSDTFSEEDENKVNDAHNEVEMALGSGFKRVNDTDNEEHWSIFGAGKEDKQ